MLGFIGGLAGAEIIVISIIFLGPIILWLISLIDVLQADFKDTITKLIWVLVIIFVPVIGALLYLVIGRKQKIDNNKPFDF